MTDSIHRRSTIFKTSIDSPVISGYTYRIGVAAAVVMGRWGFRIRSGGVVAATALVFLAPAAAVAIPADLAMGSGQVVLRRTAHGIPHVLARDYGGLGYGAGYAYAQDNLCALADDILTVSGQRSRWFGPDALTADQVDNLDSDVYFTDVN